MSTIHWMTEPLSLLFCTLGLAQAAHSIAARAHNEVPPWQLWGPYRPNLYFGVRPQIPDTFLMGLMWASGESRDDMLETLRDTCEQDDGMQGYGWTEYDTRTGGSQTIRDAKLHIDLTTEFVKSDDGNSWSVRVAGAPRLDAPDSLNTTVIFHAAIEKATLDSRTLICGDEVQRVRSQKNVEAECHGKAPGLGPFRFSVTTGGQSIRVHDSAVNSVEVDEGKIWQAKSVFAHQIKAAKGDTVAVEHRPGTGNMHFTQMTFSGAFSATFAYRTSEGSFFDSGELDTGLHDLESIFHTNVDKVFPRTSPFDQEKYANFTQALLANLLAGLGFFHGDSKVDNSRAREYQETDLDFWEKAETAMDRAEITTIPPTSLFTFTPSRPFFPRGFLWDEGFHLLPILEWDLDLAVSVLRSWINLMDDDGWIAREQILGAEARSRVPEKFQVQYPHYANPPALMLLLPTLISKLTGASPYVGHPSGYTSSADEAAAMLKEFYPLFARHYNWFRDTQAGNFSTKYPRPENAVDGEGYRWRGRTPQHALTSGLDDYPRANPPHPAELHVDALAWVGASAQALQQVAGYLGEEEDAVAYEEHLADIKNNLDVLHWDPEELAYCDATIEGGAYKRVCHEGYVSLFPLLLGLLDAEHPNLPHVLDMLSDPERLWSPHGVRSLSAADEHYRTDEDYWRGPVWMHLNVLAALRLRDIGIQGQGKKPGPAQTRAASLASELRNRVVDTVYNSWDKTGFVWEQYDDKTGEGRRSRAFTGWTACVILLMGLGDTQPAGEGRESAGPSPSVAPVAAFAVCVLFVMFRRQVVGVGGEVLRYWHGRRQKWKSGRRYDEVVDLDDYGP